MGLPNLSTFPILNLLTHSKGIGSDAIFYDAGPGDGFFSTTNVGSYLSYLTYFGFSLNTALPCSTVLNFSVYC